MYASVFLEIMYSSIGLDKIQALCLQESMNVSVIKSVQLCVSPFFSRFS